MDIDGLKYHLESMGKRMLNLAERLDKDGDSLDKYDKDLVRTALIPVVKERLDIALLEYMTGNTPDILREFDI